MKDKERESRETKFKKQKFLSKKSILSSNQKNRNVNKNFTN